MLVTNAAERLHTGKQPSAPPLCNIKYDVIQLSSYQRDANML